MSAIGFTGIATAAVALAGWAYLRVRVRQMEKGVKALAEFGALAQELSTAKIGAARKAQLISFNAVIGSGRVANPLLRKLVRGELNTPVTRDRVLAERGSWSGVNRDLRIKFVQAMFTGLLADSYGAGLMGTLFRRAFFYLASSPAEVANSVEAYETKVLITGAQVITKCVQSERDHDKSFAHA